MSVFSALTLWSVVKVIVSCRELWYLRIYFVWIKSKTGMLAGCLDSMKGNRLPVLGQSAQHSSSQAVPLCALGPWACLCSPSVRNMADMAQDSTWKKVQCVFCNFSMSTNWQIDIKKIGFFGVFQIVLSVLLLLKKQKLYSSRESDLVFTFSQMHIMKMIWCYTGNTEISPWAQMNTSPSPSFSLKNSVLPVDSHFTAVLV